MKQYLCIGTYTEPILFGTGEVYHGKGKGIYLCELQDGMLCILEQLEMRNPSYLTIDEKRKKIYAVNEMKEFEGQFGGSLTEVDYSKGKLEAVNCVVTKGTDPCHVEMEPNGRFLSVANFASGSVTVFFVDEEGHLTNHVEFFQHEGSSVHPVRQKGPHAHGSIFCEKESMIFVPDLGIDKVKAYRYSADKIVALSECDISVPEGSGPRFGSFDKDNNNFYLINEIASEIIHFSYKNGKMEMKNTVCTLPDDFEKEKNICSDLHITPNGKYLYASNRGHDSICCYKIDDEGELNFMYRKKCGGKTPRNFAIDPTGKFLLVGNQDSDTIVTFLIEEDGALTQISKVEFPSPVCIRFFSSKSNPLT